ncbi:MAG TPA: hypothetical protein VGD66_14840 [Allosphingosinicella sp.]|jgi:hypothetical protein
MIAMLLAVAAQAPVLLASNDETRWRMFVRASLQSRTAAPEPDGSRLKELEGVVRRLREDAGTRGMAGPSGL